MSRPLLYASLFDKLFANSIILPWCGCYIWMGQSHRGRGKLSVRIDGKHENISVYRAAYEAFYKVQLPAGRKNPLLHTCHISLCWRPEHLIRGTVKQNVHDTLRNGTHVSGFRAYNEQRRQAKHIRSIVREEKK